MKKAALASELRHKLLNNAAPAFASEIAAAPDDEIICAYNICSCCDELKLDAEDLNFCIKEAHDADEFVELVDIIYSSLYDDEPWVSSRGGDKRNWCS